MNVKADWKLIVAALIAVLVLYYVFKRELGAAASAVGSALNPINPGNVFAGGINAVGEAVTNEAGWSLGGALFGAFHDDELNEAVAAPVVLRGRVLEEGGR